MRRRACAASSLCGLLVAGCGTATRVDFAGHSRPAPPVAVSVLVPASAPGVGTAARFDPSTIRPGPVLFNIANQSAYAERFSVREHGALLSETAPIAPGQTAQLKATLSGSADTFDTSGRELSAPFATASSRQSLHVHGRARTGDSALMQP